MPPIAVSLALTSATGAQGVSTSAPASPAVVPAGKCAVVRDTDAQGKETFSLRGEGFTKGDKVSFLGPSHSGTGFTVDADGAFVVKDVKDGQYHILVNDGEDTIKCAKAKGEQSQKDEERAKGFSDGFKAVKANCQAKQPQGIAPRTAEYNKGWDAGAAAAAAKFC
ncbi:hypothetical protein [Streptomyces sp. NPDC048256]|uniref:hypothetical protein n=1 Tax=unclassified Streptomyces TaxID=2593676 RepID=UPI0033C12C4F